MLRKHLKLMWRSLLNKNGTRIYLTGWNHNIGSLMIRYFTFPEWFSDRYIPEPGTDYSYLTIKGQ